MRRRLRVCYGSSSCRDFTYGREDGQSHLEARRAGAARLALFTITNQFDRPSTACIEFALRAPHNPAHVGAAANQDPDARTQEKTRAPVATPRTMGGLCHAGTPMRHRFLDAQSDLPSL